MRTKFSFEMHNSFYLSSVCRLCCTEPTIHVWSKRSFIARDDVLRRTVKISVQRGAVEELFLNLTSICTLRSCSSLKHDNRILYPSLFLISYLQMVSILVIVRRQ